MKRFKDYTVEKTFQGAWRISTVHNGFFISKQYFDYTRKEAIELFLSELE